MRRLNLPGGGPHLVLPDSGCLPPLHGSTAKQYPLDLCGERQKEPHSLYEGPKAWVARIALYFTVYNNAKALKKPGQKIEISISTDTMASANQPPIKEQYGAGSPAMSINSTITTNDGLTPRPTTFVRPLVQSLKARPRRATRACLACRSRKVRCDVTQNYPCKRQNSLTNPSLSSD